MEKEKERGKTVTINSNNDADDGNVPSTKRLKDRLSKITEKASTIHADKRRRRRRKKTG